MAVTQALLQRFKPFESITDEQMEAIAPHLELSHASKGTFLIKRGKPLKAISFLVEGRVDLVDASFNSESVEAGTERSRDPLTRQSPSDVSALAKSDVEVLNVEEQAFEVLDNWRDVRVGNPLAGEGQDSGDDWMTALLDSPLFSQVPPTQLQQLFASFEPVTVEAGDTVVEESAEGDYFYVIEFGHAKVVTRFDGEVATLGPGKFFGEEALVGDTIRNASVIMTTPGVVMRLSKENFKALLQEPLIRYLTGEELHQQAVEGENYLIIDVRIPLEYRMGHVKDSANIPLASLRKRLGKLAGGASYVITDDAGKRSEVAAHLMCQAGFNTFILKNSSEHYGS
ncbi:cyclic nucleotide-binding domain-containing protein [Proteobacteria bacterium 005FR1]|nr:cyclic nucleotide-binding domain-containing protein [Proteobacteria bacterium 005FR1]